MIAPMALHSHLSSKSYDATAFGFYSVGVLGMVAHFWRDRPVGMAWSAGCAYLGVVLFALKFLPRLLRSKSTVPVKLHLSFAFSNFFVVGAWGVMLAIHKVYGFLPTSSGPNVIAHAHLATVGWATMMVFGVAYRLLPMFLPAEPPKGRVPLFSCIILEIGILGFFFATILNLEMARFFPFLIAIGILTFFYSAIRMMTKRKPAPPPLPPQPDFSLMHAPFSFLCLLVCIFLGFLLLRFPQNEQTLRLALAYLVLGLIGFLSQIVTGLKPKILSIFTWYHVFSRTGSRDIPRPVDMPVRVFQITNFALWVIGVPCLIIGTYTASAFLIRAGATLLLAGLIIATFHEWTILKLIWKK